MLQIVQRLFFAIFLSLVIHLTSMAQDAGDPNGIRSPEAEYSPYLEHNYPDQVFFGDSSITSP